MNTAPPKIDVDRNVPIPKAYRHSGLSETLRRMKVGDSFQLPNPKSRSGLYSLATRLGMKIVIREDPTVIPKDPEKVRVWRVK